MKTTSFSTDMVLACASAMREAAKNIKTTLIRIKPFTIRWVCTSLEVQGQGGAGDSPAGSGQGNRLPTQAHIQLTSYGSQQTGSYLTDECPTPRHRLTHSSHIPYRS